MSNVLTNCNFWQVHSSKLTCPIPPCDKCGCIQTDLGGIEYGPPRTFDGVNGLWCRKLHVCVNCTSAPNASTTKIGYQNMSRKIRIAKGDITTLKVDAIVNAAHNALLGGGGVDGAIHKAAGPELLSACRGLEVDENGCRCKTGEAHITKGYNLPAKYVIHTVAPKFVGGLIRKIVDGKSVAIFSENCDKEGNLQMAMCYKNCLEIADQQGIESIAFPSLGTGGHAYPIETACPIALNTVLEYLPKTKNIKQVIFVCFSDSDYKFYGEQANQIFKDK